ncbi:MAG: hypothetical protein K5877_01985 [Lachnospiraceae bacterium]|nr:hypothetical protein [Lachnospiraceae bacterium]
MSEHGKKKIAPIVITGLMILYYGIYFGFLIAVLPGLPVKLLLGLIPLVLGLTSIYVCMERLHEIDKGEEDDLSKY